MGIDVNHLCHNAGNFGRCVELSFTLSAFGSEVPHQVFVGVSKYVVALCAVTAEIQFRLFKYSNQVAQPVNLLFALTHLFIIVKVGNGDNTGQVIGFGKFPDNLIDFVANVGLPFQLHHVFETAAFGNINQCAAFVGYVFHKQQNQYIVLVLACIHAASQFVAACPKGAV